MTMPQFTALEPGQTRLSTMQRLSYALSRPRGASTLLVVAVCGYVAAIVLLGWRFLVGEGPFWTVPQGSVGHAWADMATALAGYRYFQQGRWIWPLLAIPQLGIPDGTNVAFTDGIPILAILGRLVFNFTEIPINLFGLWTASCLAGSSVALTLLVRLLGGRSAAAAIAAGVMGFTFPTLLFRWGHPALMAQAEIIVALALYVWRRRTPPGLSPFCLTSALCCLALLTNAYLFLMVGGLVAAFYLQDAWSRPEALLRHMAEVACLGLILCGIMAACGWLGAHDAAGKGAALRTIGYGQFSANLLGPFIPQRSGLIPEMSRLVVDATGAQYEGFSYLGAGLLVLVAAMLLHGDPGLKAVRRHPVMTVCLLGFGLLSLSDQIFLGPVQIASLPLPPFVRSIMEVVRSSGRFVWPPLYAAAALALAAAARRSSSTILLLAAAALQWADTAPLRQIMAAEIANPPIQPVAFGALRQAIAGHDAVLVMPSFACLPNPAGWSKTFALEVEAAASAAFVPTNTVYQSRHTADCSAELRAATLPAGDRIIRAYLPEWPGFKSLAAAANPACVVGEQLILCGAVQNAQVLQQAVRANPAWKAPVMEPWLEDVPHDDGH
jgi:hypothetical protein